MPKLDLVPGTLDMLILRVLQSGPAHGWAIAQRIELLTSEVLRVEEGSLYPALFRADKNGWVESEWGQSENNRKAKFYTLTKAGKKHLQQEERSWNQLVAAIAQVLNAP